MLKSLHVENFALIEDAQVNFVAGLNVLTGETGAGKSILVDAFNSILGSRASLDNIRTGSDFFRVEAVFDIPEQNSVLNLLEEQGISLEEDGRLIISRRLSRHGKNLILINGCNITLSILRQIGAYLVDMHGQHENQALLRADYHLALIDEAHASTKSALAAYRTLYREWIELNRQLSVTEDDARERAQRMDMLTWQTGEIATAALEVGEEEFLEREIIILNNSEKIARSVKLAYFLLQQGKSGNSGIVEELSEVKRELENVARFDSGVLSQLAAVTDVLYQLEEVSADLRDYSGNMEFDAQRLTQLQERMDVIYKMKKKYGSSEAEILEYYRQATKELAAITSLEERTGALLVTREALKERLSAVADQLTELRREAGGYLTKQVCENLADMAMPKAKLLVKIGKTAGFTPTGRDEVTLLFSANPGEEPKPLHKIASGGELSRIALAIKSVSAQRDDIGTMVFDEIDAGIGGQTARMVGEKIATVGYVKQVLCITHLPHIACMADAHIYLEKQTDGERTQTIVRILERDSRLGELTRMMGGDNLNPLAVENAAQLLTAAAIKKDNWKKHAQA